MHEIQKPSSASVIPLLSYITSYKLSYSKLRAMDRGEGCSIALDDSKDPFKATTIWRGVISSFRAGMPSKRRRAKMHFYDNCFSGAEALQWLHHHLQVMGTFGADITEEKVQKLLQKFLTSDVIEEVKGKPRGEFKNDSCTFYRFVTQPGPFNFIDTPRKQGSRKSMTPLSSLGKRNRKDRRLLSDCDGEIFANDHASTSFDEESFVTPSRRRGDAGEGEGEEGGSPWVCRMELGSPMKQRCGEGEGRSGESEGAGGVSRVRGVRRGSSDVVRGRQSVAKQRRCRESEGAVSAMPVVVGSQDSQVVEGRKEKSSARRSGGGGGARDREALVAKVSKELTLNRLLHLIELPSLDGVLTQHTVRASHVACNISSVTRIVGGACSSAAHTCLAAISGGVMTSHSGQQPHPPPPPLAPAAHVTKRRSSSSSKPFQRRCSSQTSDADGDFPQWVILSMNCISKWPDGCSEEFVGGMPMYGGFELDVFQSLVDFFRSLPEPLVSSGLYELFMAMIKLIKTDHAHSVEALQLCFLLLPRAQRLKLHRVLRFLSKAASNQQLQLSISRTNWSVLLENFAPVVLQRSSKVDPAERAEVKEDGRVLVTFMVKNYHEILEVPEDLKTEIQERVRQLEEGKGSPVEIRHAFCQQVSSAEYQAQNNDLLRQQMGTLLSGIMDDQHMSFKEKTKKLKMFQQQYPAVYTARSEAGGASPLTELTNSHQHGGPPRGGQGSERSSTRSSSSSRVRTGKRSRMLRSVLKSPSLHAPRIKH